MDCNKPTTFFVPQTGPANGETSGGAGMFTCKEKGGYVFIEYASKVKFLGQKIEPTKGLPTEGLGSEGVSSDSEPFDTRSVKNVKVELSAPTVLETVVAKGIDAVKAYVSETTIEDLELSELIQRIKNKLNIRDREAYLKEVFFSKGIDGWFFYLETVFNKMRGLMESIKIQSDQDRDFNKEIIELRTMKSNVKSLNSFSKQHAALWITDVSKLSDLYDSSMPELDELMKSIKK